MAELQEHVILQVAAVLAKHAEVVVDGREGVGNPGKELVDARRGRLLVEGDAGQTGAEILELRTHFLGGRLDATRTQPRQDKTRHLADVTLDRGLVSAGLDQTGHAGEHEARVAHALEHQRRSADIVVRQAVLVKLADLTHQQEAQTESLDQGEVVLGEIGAEARVVDELAE